jgi:hypothetical protein
VNVQPALGDWTVPNIESLEVSERRAFAEFEVAGRVGSVFQDLNSQPLRVAIRGSLFGEEDRSAFFDEIREKFQKGEPVTFVADIVHATTVEYVLITNLEFAENATRPDQIDYHIELKESPPPPPPETFPGLDAGLLDQAGDLLGAVEGALDVLDALGSVPSFGDPTPPLNDALSSVTAATTGLEEALTPLADIFGS